MSGVSTFVWGPSLWRVMHTLSFGDVHELRTHEPAIAKFLTCLQDVLPCRHCRDSYKTFLTELPDVQHALQTDTFRRWMYDLHDKVNVKLQTASPSFDMVVKRYAVRPVQWTNADVCDIIALIGINYRADVATSYETFWSTLPTVLRAGRPTEPAIAQLLHRTPTPVNTETFIAVAILVDSVLHNHRAPTSTEVDVRTKMYRRAVSGSCQNGVCA